MTIENAILDCPHGADCGACSFLGTPYGSQLERKRRRLIAVLGEQMKIDNRQVLPTLPSPKAEGYRNRAKMTISTNRDRRSAVGYFQRRSRNVVDAPHCGVLVPELLDTTRRFRALLNSSLQFPFNLRHIDLRCGSDPTRQHLTLVVRSDTMPRLPVEAVADACPQVVGMGVNLNPKGGPQVVKGRIEPVFGAREVWVQSAGLNLRVSPGSFFQVNLGLLPEIHSRMAAFFGEGDVLLDLFAGVGTHGLALRRHFSRVICVEGVRSSVADAKASVKAAGVENVEIIGDPIHRALRRIGRERPEAVILNPSAAGADAPTLKAVITSPARSVAYLSCDPSTLARDLAALVEGGFALTTAQVVDMMPQTRQVESLALLRR
ncbi:MAG: 23S rRNA (uracil(1939)-C(5))-methyltransferase RlmD [Thermoanaerobaculales bacterium]|nr:23S rRNA (uracil(1939)-C(5))-methyltransferase RlmD [Thermoanaerobaculales bacterium]